MQFGKAIQKFLQMQVANKDCNDKTQVANKDCNDKTQVATMVATKVKLKSKLYVIKKIVKEKTKIS